MVYKSRMVKGCFLCPKCGTKGSWRRGVGFEHEMICMKCFETWEPNLDVPSTYNDILDVELLKRAALGAVTELLAYIDTDQKGEGWAHEYIRFFGHDENYVPSEDDFQTLSEMLIVLKRCLRKPKEASLVSM